MTITVAFELVSPSATDGDPEEKLTVGAPMFEIVTVEVALGPRVDPPAQGPAQARFTWKVSCNSEQPSSLMGIKMVVVVLFAGMKKLMAVFTKSTVEPLQLEGAGGEFNAAPPVAAKLPLTPTPVKLAVIKTLTGTGLAMRMVSET